MNDNTGNDSIMEKELEILQQIQDNECITQRDLAQNTGLSLGAVNLLIKKLINTGLIKIEKLNPQKIRYILTPQGITEKTLKTYNYIVKSYNSLLHMQTMLRKVIDAQYNKGTKYFYLYGEQDEVLAMMLLTFQECAKEYSIRYKQILLKEQIRKKEKTAVFVWSIDKQMEFENDEIECVNVLEIM